jgi:acyl-CoA thioester hydrolase
MATVGESHTTPGVAAEANGEFVWPLRVYYEDTDAAGVVYYANYLKFMERARTEWVRRRGLDQTTLRYEHGIVFAVSRLVIDYRRPARLDDSLRVGVRLTKLGRASFLLEQRILRASRDLLCRADVRLACVAAQTLKPRAIPKVVASELKRDPGLIAL